MATEKNLIEAFLANLSPVLLTAAIALWADPFLLDERRSPNPIVQSYILKLKKI